MTDDRLAILDSVAESATAYGPIRINRIKISNFKFFYGDFEVIINNRNMLIYGENGSGKSSIYHAIGYLADRHFQRIDQERNIFCETGYPQIEFGFSNGSELIIDSDLTELPESMASYLDGLTIFRPMLDYKKLLKVHYQPISDAGEVNIYDMLREIFKNYPVEDDRVLSDIRNPPEYFEALRQIVNDVLLNETNRYIRFFDADFKIDRFVFRQEFTPDGRLNPVITIDVDFRETILNHYHTFLNEARLSALAISLYFAAIRILLGSLRNGCIKLLVLDDLLISLDMGNRFRLLEILKSGFADFQIFFFTHDKELFEIYKNKLDWAKFEIYYDEKDGIPEPLLKPYHSEVKRAKTHFEKRELDCCAMLLRKEFERFLKTFLSPAEQRNRHGDELDLASLVSKAKTKSSGEAKIILDRLDTNRKHLFNPLCHHDTANVFMQEVKAAIDDLEKLIAILK